MKIISNKKILLIKIYGNIINKYIFLKLKDCIKYNYIFNKFY